MKRNRGLEPCQSIFLATHNPMGDPGTEKCTVEVKRRSFESQLKCEEGTKEDEYSKRDKNRRRPDQSANALSSY